MRRQITVAFGLAGAVAATAAQALGLGTLRIDSGLNQPLAAEIPLLSVAADEVASVRVRLADAEAFRRLGIERADFLSDLRFEVLPGAAPVIRISSARPARDPFLTFLLDVRSDRERLVREYTVLLDPPAEAVSRSPATASAAVTPPLPRPVAAPTARPAAGAGVVATTPPLPTPRAAVVLSTEPDPVRADAPFPTGPASSAPAAADDAAITRYGPVKPQETLWSIASAVRPDAATVNQTQLALYLANPQAFDRGRFNGLLRGATLTVPPASVITQVDPITARDRVVALQSGKTAAVTAATRPPRPTPPVTPRPTLRPTPLPTPLATPLPTPVSTPEATPIAPAPTLPVVQAPQEDATATDGPVEEEGRPSEALVDAAPPESADAQPVEANDLASAPETPSAEAETVETDAVAPPLSAPTAAPSAGLLEALRLPLILILAALGLGAGLWTLRRRRAAQADGAVPAVRRPPVAAPAVSASAAAAAASGPGPGAEASTLADEAEAAVMAAYAGGRDETAVLPAFDGSEVEPPPSESSRAPRGGSSAASFEERDDFESTQILSASTADRRAAVPDTPEFSLTGQFQVDAVQVDLGSQDPAAEADIHMAYGLYDEAELSLNNALQTSPDRPEWLFKLAEVQFAAGRGLPFVETAERAKPHLSEADWQKLALLGRQIAPEHPLFAEADDAAAMAADVDLAFDEPAPSAADDVPDFVSDKTVVLPAEALASEPAASELPSFEETLAGLQLESMETPPAAAASEIDPNALEFNLDDFQVDDPTVTPSAPTPESVGSGQAPSGVDPLASSFGERLDFELALDPVMSDPLLTPAAPPQYLPPSTPPEMENRLEFNLDDFDAPALAEPATSAPTTDLRGDGIDFQLDSFDLEDSDRISAGDEAATKLDLARAYVDMGDQEMAQALLNEVLVEGSPAQQDEARALIARMA